MVFERKRREERTVEDINVCGYGTYETPRGREGERKREKEKEKRITREITIATRTRSLGNYAIESGEESSKNERVDFSGGGDSLASDGEKTKGRGGRRIIKRGSTVRGITVTPIARVKIPRHVRAFVVSRCRARSFLSSITDATQGSVDIRVTFETIVIGVTVIRGASLARSLTRLLVRSLIRKEKCNGKIRFHRARYNIYIKL